MTDLLKTGLTVFAWAVLLTAFVIFAAVYVVEPLIAYLKWRSRRRSWEAIQTARREWEIDEYKASRVDSQNARWEYVWPKDVA